MKVPISLHVSPPRHILSLLILTLLLAGCGSNIGQTSGVGTGGTGSLAKSLSGKVADGYLFNATVFLDKNGNYQLDEGEPNSTTDVDGVYIMDIDPADLGKYPIVALAIKGITVDRDTDKALENSFILSMPKESVSGTPGNNFISPLTTQLREMMETGLFNSIPQAKEALRGKMALPPGTEMTADYLDPGNLDPNKGKMHTVARNIAAVMGSQMGHLLGTSGSATTVDVNRYRGMMGAIFSNMSSVRSVNVQTGMSSLNSSVTVALSGMPPASPGRPYMNMSTAFRGPMGGMRKKTGM